MVCSKIIDIEHHNFDVAVTFAGESRDFVEQVVRELEKILGTNRVFYDNDYESQLARPGLDFLLQDIYKNRSKLIVVFLSGKYQEKKWCGLEFKAVRDFIMSKELKRIMYVRMDLEHVDGVFNTDGYIDATKKTPQAIAGFINQRLTIL
ncbi:hypothetical protein SPSIL_048900 [Sporomusa silvacetica DSM 10669]|uniref:TIR domain-containing protein n=1 Tax=Sporomusa silvacetica DSM 10669 TaxID=1123289 RepID=A0ABZ3ITB9_9FIRM|nr:TIR domain-containing protein [Sporomusa silvacetica]OZC19426.1 hypothetical protein SPSIL_21260 [Sporomusa silvacetica DSM 10669]